MRKNHRNGSSDTAALSATPEAMSMGKRSTRAASVAGHSAGEIMAQTFAISMPARKHPAAGPRGI
jgi:hypothetical protein